MQISFGVLLYRSECKSYQITPNAYNRRTTINVRLACSVIAQDRSKKSCNIGINVNLLYFFMFVLLGVDHERHIRPLGQEYPIPSKLNKGCKKSMSSNCKSSTKEFDKEIVLEEDIIKIREDEDKNIWLYNIKSDPNEYTDLSDKYPEIVMLLLERLTVHNFTAVACRFPGWDTNADPSMHGGLWGPWQD